MNDQAQEGIGAYNAAEYDADQAVRDAEHDRLKTDEPKQADAFVVDNAPLEADGTADATRTGEFTVVTEPVETADAAVDEETTAVEETRTVIHDEELHQFERRIDQILSTGELDETLRVIDTEGVAQVLPVLDSEPISHLLEGIEEIGGRANVFVSTADGIAVLNVVEYSPDEQSVKHADDTPTGETPTVTETETTIVTDTPAQD